MESLTTLEISQKIKQHGLKFATYSTLSGITGIANRNTLYKVTQRLVSRQVLISLDRGKFKVTDAHASEFEIANFVYQPSYISLHSALSHYGILSQFVYSVTSITTRKTKSLVIGEIEYVFSHIDQDLFWGYEKTNHALFACPEKALLDSLYFMSKGLISLDLEDLDMSIINPKKLKKMAQQFQNSNLMKTVQELNL